MCNVCDCWRPRPSQAVFLGVGRHLCIFRSWIYNQTHAFYVVTYCFVDPDPDPVGSKTFSRIRIQIRMRKKSFRIRTAPDPKWIRSKLSKKLIIFDNFSTKNAQFKYINSFLSKKLPKKLTSRHNVQPKRLTRREYKGNLKFYVKM